MYFKFYLLLTCIFIVGCNSKDVLLTSESLPYSKIFYYDGFNRIVKEAICNDKEELVKLKKFHLDTITEFNFIKNDTFSKFEGLEEGIYVNNIFSKSLILKGKVIFNGKALEIDSVNNCICKRKCNY